MASRSKTDQRYINYKNNLPTSKYCTCTSCNPKAELQFRRVSIRWASFHEWMSCITNIKKIGRVDNLNQWSKLSAQQFWFIKAPNIHTVSSRLYNKLKVVVIFFSYVLCKFLLLLLSLSPFLSTFFFFVWIWWKPKGTNCFIMHIQAKCNSRVESHLRFIGRVDITSLLRYHPSIRMVNSCIDCSISDCLRDNTLSISNRIWGVQPKLFSNISQRNTRIRNANVAKPSPNDIMSQSHDQVVGSIWAESTGELLSNSSEKLQVTNSHSLEKKKNIGNNTLRKSIINWNHTAIILTWSWTWENSKPKLTLEPKISPLCYPSTCILSTHSCNYLYYRQLTYGSH